MGKKAPDFEVPEGIVLSPDDLELAIRIHRSEHLSSCGIYPGTIVLDFREGAKRLLAEKYHGLYSDKDQPC